MSAWMRALALVCAVLMLKPGDVQAATFQTGVGYLNGGCRTITTSDEQACFSGERWDLGLNFTVKGETAERKVTSEDFRVDQGWTGQMLNFGSHASNIGVLIGTIVFIFLVYGIVWGVAALFSHRLSLGLYSNFDFEKADVDGKGGLDVEKYRQQSTGVQAMMYLLEDYDVALNVGVAGTTAQVQATAETGADRSYHLRGVSSKIALGYVPFERTGVYALLAWEGTYFGTTGAAKYVDAGHRLRTHHSSAVVLGVAF